MGLITCILMLIQSRLCSEQSCSANSQPYTYLLNQDLPPLDPGLLFFLPPLVLSSSSSSNHCYRICVVRPSFDNPCLFSKKLDRYICITHTCIYLGIAWTNIFLKYYTENSKKERKRGRERGDFVF